MSPSSRDGIQYQPQLSAARRTIDQLPADFWNDNLYSRWLGALRSLRFEYEDTRLPKAMRTRAWQMKNLNTQLASWTHLKHDTLLYAKQPYSGLFLCFYPTGYVDPVPELYDHLNNIAAVLASLIQKLPPVTSAGVVQDRDGIVLQAPTDRGSPFGGTVSDPLRTLRQISQSMLTLSGIARTELAGEPFTAAQINFIQSLMEDTGASYFGKKRYSGWYPQMFFKNIFEQNQTAGDYDFQGSDRFDALIADVQTDPNGLGAVLEQAVGNVHLLMIALDSPHGVCVYAGPVLSHYEFYTEGLIRLSDDQWKAKLNGVPPPELPEWTREYQVPGKVENF